MDDKQALIQGLIENIQREDMAPLETAEALKMLMELMEWTSPYQVAEAGIMSQGQASRLLALIKEPEPIKQILRENNSQGITERHVREVRAVISDKADEPVKIAVIEKAAAEGLTAAQTRQVAEAVKAAPSEEARLFNP